MYLSSRVLIWHAQSPSLVPKTTGKEGRKEKKKDRREGKEISVSINNEKET